MLGPRRGASCSATASLGFVHAGRSRRRSRRGARTESRTRSSSGCANRFGEWRHLEAHVTDLRDDRHVRGVVLNARDVTERVRLEEELTRQAFHDALTGLANRALFRDRLDQALARSARSRSVARRAARRPRRLQAGQRQPRPRRRRPAAAARSRSRFAEVIRPSDTLARLGGDEFALLLEGADEAQARRRRRARCSSASSEPLSVAGRELARRRQHRHRRPPRRDGRRARS